MLRRIAIHSFGGSPVRLRPIRATKERLHLNFSPGVGTDKLSSYKGPTVRQMIEAAGTTVLYLTPYSLDFDLIGCFRRSPRWPI